MGPGAVKADPLLPLYQAQRGGRAGRDRLELLTALIGGPAFDPLFRAEVIRIPAGHPVFRWGCLVAGCERPRKGSIELCHIHHEQWSQARARGEGKAAFFTTAQPLGPSIWVEQVPCRICPGRPPHTLAGCCVTVITKGMTSRAWPAVARHSGHELCGHGCVWCARD